MGALSDGEERLTVGSFHPHHHIVTVLYLDGAGIECGVDAESLHKIGVARRIEVVAPLQRGMVGGHHRKLVSFVNPVILDGHIDPLK